MSKLRRNRKSGQGKYVNLGFLGKYKTYRNTEFERVPDLTDEERQQQIADKLKPYTYDPNKHKVVRAAGPVEVEPSPTPSPTVTPTPSSTPPVQYRILTEGSDSIITEGDDNLVQEGAPDPTPTPTPTASVTPSVTPTISVTPSITPSITPSASVPVFSPSDIDGLTIWYDFDDTSSMTLSGSDIQGIEDKSGNNFDMSANSGSEPTLSTDSTYGGNNTAVFNGTTDEMYHYLSTTYTGMTGHSFYYVFKMEEISGSNQQAPYQVINDVGGDEDRFWGTYYENTNRFRTHTEAMEANFTPYTSFTSQYPYLLLVGRVYDNGAGGSVVDVSLNDTAPSSTSTGAYDLEQFDKIGVGGRVDVINNDEMLGNWGEFIFYDRKLTDSENTQVVTYLKNKWNYTNW